MNVSANIAMTKAMPPSSTDTPSEPAMNHAAAATTPPVAAEPSSLPKMARSMLPRTMKPTMTKGLNGSKWLSRSESCQCGGSGAGSVSPSMRRIIRSIPAAMPPAKSPLLNLGVMSSSMMRLLVTSVSTPSRP